MADTSLIIALENSPTRCTQITVKGQCVNEGREGTKPCLCPMHGRIHGAIKQRKDIAELYKWKFENDMKDFSNAGVMSLKAEVSILRTMLAKLLQTCVDAPTLILNIGPISKLNGDIASLLTAMDRINMNSGNLLDANDIQQIAQEIVMAISDEIDDAEVLQRLAYNIENIVLSKFSPSQLQSN